MGASPGRVATRSSRLRPRSPSARRLPAPGPLSRRRPKAGSGRSQVSSRADSRGLWWPPRPQPPVGVGAEDLPDPTQPVLTERFPRGLRVPLPQTPGPWVCFCSQQPEVGEGRRPLWSGSSAVRLCERGPRAAPSTRARAPGALACGGGGQGQAHSRCRLRRAFPRQNAIFF